MISDSITLEDSDGKTVKNPTEAQIISTLEKIGSTLDHCILDLGDPGFLQAAGSKGRLLIQYSDGSDMYESVKSDFTAAAVGKIFLDAMSGRTEWKKEFAFTSMNDTGGSGKSQGAATGHGPAEAQNRSFKEGILGTVKNEVSSGIGRLISKAVKGIFRK